MGRGCSTPHRDGGSTHHCLQQARPSLDSWGHNQTLPCSLHRPHTPLRRHTCEHLAFQATALRHLESPLPPFQVFCAINTHILQPRLEPSFQSFPFKGVAPISWLNSDPHDHSTEDRVWPAQCLCSAPLLCPLQPLPLCPLSLCPRCPLQPVPSAHSASVPSAHSASVPSAHLSLCPLCPAGSRITCCLSSKSPVLSCGCPDPVHLLTSG